MNNNHKFIITESHLRSVVKALIYRVFSIIGTVALSWFVTKDIKETVLITIAFQVYLTILYYVYERIWNKIDWERKIKA